MILHKGASGDLALLAPTSCQSISTGRRLILEQQQQNSAGRRRPFRIWNPNFGTFANFSRGK